MSLRRCAHFRWFGSTSSARSRVIMDTWNGWIHSTFFQPNTQLLPQKTDMPSSRKSKAVEIAINLLMAMTIAKYPLQRMPPQLPHGLSEIAQAPCWKSTTGTTQLGKAPLKSYMNARRWQMIIALVVSSRIRELKASSKAMEIEQRPKTCSNGPGRLNTFCCWSLSASIPQNTGERLFMPFKFRRPEAVLVAFKVAVDIPYFYNDEKAHLAAEFHNNNI